MIINIENLNYYINNDEFKQINHAEYNYLKLYNDIGIFERIIGLIKKTKECFDENVQFISYDTTLWILLNYHDPCADRHSIDADDAYACNDVYADGYYDACDYAGYAP